MGKEMMVKVRDIDPKFKYDISKFPGAEKVMLCFQCGICTADCPIARFNDFYRPRKLIRMVQLGLKKRLLLNDVLWLCSTCFTCVDHCPQDVGVVNIVRVLRNLTVKEGEMPDVYRHLASSILKTGYAYKIPDSRIKRRVSDELPLLPEVNLENLEKLFKVTGLSNMLERGES